MRMRAINHYRLDGEDASITASGHRYSTSAFRGESPAYRIHGTPGYPRTMIAGLTFRFGGK